MLHSFGRECRLQPVSQFVRKSVAGLSITLFVAAFLGNFFYVLSILTNPIMNAPIAVRTRYIQETLP